MIHASLLLTTIQGCDLSVVPTSRSKQEISTRSASTAVLVIDRRHFASMELLGYEPYESGWAHPQRGKYIFSSHSSSVRHQSPAHAVLCSGPAYVRAAWIDAGFRVGWLAWALPAVPPICFMLKPVYTAHAARQVARVGTAISRKTSATMRLHRGRVRVYQSLSKVKSLTANPGICKMMSCENFFDKRCFSIFLPYQGLKLPVHERAKPVGLFRLALTTGMVRIETS